MAEICANTLDDDCNGTVGNGCACVPGDTISCCLLQVPNGSQCPLGPEGAHLEAGPVDDFMSYCDPSIMSCGEDSVICCEFGFRECNASGTAYGTCQ